MVQVSSIVMYCTLHKPHKKVTFSAIMDTAFHFLWTIKDPITNLDEKRKCVKHSRHCIVRLAPRDGVGNLGQTYLTVLLGCWGLGSAELCPPQGADRWRRILPSEGTRAPPIEKKYKLNFYKCHFSIIMTPQFLSQYFKAVDSWL